MAPARRTNPISNCPLTAALSALGGKWKLIIIFWLAESPRQFGELRKLLEPVSQKVLTEQLRELIADEIITREETGPVPAPVVYSLTDYGRSLMPLVEAVRGWGRGHIERFRLAEESPDDAATASAAASLPAAQSSGRAPS